MPFISDDTVAQVLDYVGVAAELEKAYRDLARGLLVIHPRDRTSMRGVRLSTMGAVWETRGVAAIKAYTAVAGEFNFLVTLFDTRQNRTLACIAGGELTKFRTAAQTALIASKVLRSPLRKVALFGAGLQGRAQAAALASLFTFQELSVVDPNGSRTWCAEFGESTGIDTHMAGAREALRDAQLVVTATRSGEPLFPGDWLEDGQVVVAIGTSTPSGRELDDVALDKARSIIVEWKPQSLLEAGEIAQWSGREASKEKISDLASLFQAGAAWPDPEDGVVIFKSVGTGLADLAAARLAHARVVDGRHLA